MTGPGSVWQVSGMPWLLGSAALWFSRAIGALGLASAAPQFVLVPLAPWLAERAGFGPVFGLAVLPALAIPLAWPIARAVGDSERAPAESACS